MRIFKRRKTKNVLILSDVTGLATRAMYDTVTGSKMPVIQITLEAKHGVIDKITGEVVDAVEFDMDLWEANKFASDLLASIDAAMPRRAMGARRLPFSGGE